MFLPRKIAPGSTCFFLGSGTLFLSPNHNNKPLKISIRSKILMDLNVALLSHRLQLTVVLLKNPQNCTAEESPKLLNWSLMGIVQIFPPDSSIAADIHLHLLG